MPELSQFPLLALMVRASLEGLQGILPPQALTERQIKTLVFAVSALLVWGFHVQGVVGLNNVFGLDASAPSAMTFVLNTLILGVSSMGFHDILDYLAGKR